MDQQRIAILQSLQSIWQFLCQGDKLEKDISSLLLIVLRSLKGHWLGLKEEINHPNYLEMDSIEYFLNHIADLD